MCFLNSNSLNSRFLEKNRLRSVFFFSLVNFRNLVRRNVKGTKGSVFLKKVGASPHIMRKKRMVKYRFLKYFAIESPQCIFILFSNLWGR
jgi:hypothetical protein